MRERVDHPDHYNKGIEAIAFIESWDMGFHAGNILKYLARAPYKGKELEDLRKARWYLDRLIEQKEASERKEKLVTDLAKELIESADLNRTNYRSDVLVSVDLLRDMQGAIAQLEQS